MLELSRNFTALGTWKSFASIILNRCKDAFYQVLREEQCGVRKSRGFIDQLFKCKKPGASVPIARKKVEVLTGNHKGRFGIPIEAENQFRLLIGREMLVGKKKNAGCFETLGGEKLKLKDSAEAELVTVSSDECSVVADLVSRANNRSSAVSDGESCLFSPCKRCFDTARGCKAHEARFCSLRNRIVSKTERQNLLG